MSYAISNQITDKAISFFLLFVIVFFKNRIFIN